MTVSSGSVQQCEIFEATHKGPADGNPFVDVQFGARFTQGGKSIDVTASTTAKATTACASCRRSRDSGATRRAAIVQT